MRRDIVKTMRSAKERAEATEAAKRKDQEKVKQILNEEERAAAFEAKQREKAINSAAKAASSGPVLMVENFADEVASYRARARKNKEVGGFSEYL